MENNLQSIMSRRASVHFNGRIIFETTRAKWFEIQGDQWRELSTASLQGQLIEFMDSAMPEGYSANLMLGVYKMLKFRLAGEVPSSAGTSDAIERAIIEGLDWSSDEAMWRETTAAGVLQELGFGKADQGAKAKASRLIFSMNGGRKRKTNGMIVLFVPCKHNPI